MKKNKLAALFLALCLTVQLNVCSANNDYDEEITLPIGTNFDLEMEEVTRYEYDGTYVKAQTVNGKEQFILQKEGDTIINVVMDDKGQKTELKVLVHIVSEKKFNEGDTPSPTPASTTAKEIDQQYQATKQNDKTIPVINQPSTPKEEDLSNNKDVKTTTAPKQEPTKKEDTVAPTAPTADKKETPDTPASKGTTAPTPEKTEEHPTEAIKTSQTITRPTVLPTNSNESIKYKAEQYAFDVLDLVNAERKKYNLRPLSMARDLQAEATLRARELTARFTHTRPDGTKFITIMSTPGKLQAENIAAGQINPAAVVKAWMSSASHRENILKPEHTELGVGYYETTSANYPCYWVQLFRG